MHDFGVRTYHLVKIYVREGRSSLVIKRNWFVEKYFLSTCSNCLGSFLRFRPMEMMTTSDNIQNHCSVLVAQVPTTQSELVIGGDYSKTVKNKNFVLYNNENFEKRIIISTTMTNLLFLLHYCGDCYMDGTFRVVTPMFKQLHTRSYF